MKSYNKVFLSVISLMWINFSYATEKEPNNSTDQEKGSQEFIVKFDCKSLQDIELRVFHVLFETKERAELTYELISSVDKKDQLHYLNVSADADSLDPGSKGKGGDIGYIYYGLFENVKSIYDINKVIYELPIDTLSPPTQSEFGWHLFWVDNARDINTQKSCTYAYWQRE